MSLAVICNHNFPDLQEFFRSKAELKKSQIGEELVFLTTFFAEDGPLVSNIPSCFSRKPFFDLFLIIDIFYGPVLALLLRVRNVKVIHFTTTHSSNIPLALVFRLFGGRVIFTIHRFDLESYDSVRRVLLSLYEKVVFLISYKIVILSDHSRVPVSKKVVIPIAGFKQYISDEKKCGDYYLFFGRIDDYKGLDDIVRLAQDLPHLRFVVAGNGKSQAIAKLECLDNVVVRNRFIENSELESLFEDARLVLLPYTSISQSGVQILSYSYATPVVCYDVGNLREFIVDKVTGYLIPAGNYHAFRSAVEVFDLKELEAMSRNCIAYFNKNFSDDVLYEQYKDFYSSIIS